MTEHGKGLLAIVISAILWSTGGVFIKLISFGAFQLSFFRSSFAALTVFVFYRRSALYSNRYVFFNAVMYSLVLILFVAATKMTTAANAIFLQYTAPIYVLVLEPILLKTKFERANIATVIVAFIGMLLFFVGDIKIGEMTGNVFALLSGIALAGFFLGQRKIENTHKISSVFYGNMLIVVICFFLIGEFQAITISDLKMVGYLGIVQIGISYILFSYSIARIQAIEASLIAMIEPVLNPIWVFIWYGEQPTLFAILGGLIIIAGVTYRSIISKQKEEFMPY